MTAWAGPDCFVRRVSASYRGMDLVNQPFTVQGEIEDVTLGPSVVITTVRLTGLSADGTASTLGSAVFDLPREPH